MAAEKDPELENELEDVADDEPQTVRHGIASEENDAAPATPTLHPRPRCGLADSSAAH